MPPPAYGVEYPENSAAVRMCYHVPNKGEQGLPGTGQSLDDVLAVGSDSTQVMTVESAMLAILNASSTSG